MQGILNIMDASGHRTVEWAEDTTNTVLGNGPVDPEYAKREFARLVAGGHLAYTEIDGELVQLHRGEYDPKAHTDVTLSSPYVGG